MPGSLWRRSIVRLLRISFTVHPAFSTRIAGKRVGTGAIRIEAAGFYSLQGKPVSVICHDERIVIAALIRAYRDVEHDVHVGVRVKTVEGAERLVVRDSHFCDPLMLCVGKRVLARMELSLPVAAGDYYVEMGLLLFPKGTKYEGQQFNFAEAEVADLVDEGVYFQVQPFAWHPIAAPVLAEARLSLRSLG